ncbi:ATPase inhibitor mai-2, mitochondrial-like isoform X2 [Mercenaria mercenaria]|uniref:ATPase inhibitor mai-2, mitochondrial-like isoform X2 n=1 Tax=Mercenaria mercenaria TaxID=6596 RepID=UPI00234F542B|nr:ATPase inhibitor mai-2, mitochondrial-like isoform X2 [Mercenaria mercenaria]
MALRLAPNLLRSLRLTSVRAMSQVGGFGEGAGKGGGAGGSIRDAGGSFGKMEAAHEEEYFRKLREKQLKEMRKFVSEETGYHHDEINRLEEAIKRHKKRLAELRKDDSDSD